jgi:serpin B
MHDWHREWEDDMSKQLRSCTLLISVVLATTASCWRPEAEPVEAPSGGELAQPGEVAHNGEVAQPGDTKPAEQPATDGAQAKTVAEAAIDNNAFGLDLYKRVAQSGENVFLSPYGIAAALAMTYEGARGDTAVQMSESLHFGVPAARLRPAFQALDQALAPAADAGYDLHVANALWGMQGHAFKPELVEVLRTAYDAPLHQVDFAESEAARATINDWVADATRNKIDELIPSGMLDALTRLVLTNAVYFKGDWAAKFDAKATTPQPFQVLQGKPVKTPLMHQVGTFGYAESTDAQVLSLPYAGEELSMIVVLPRQVDGLSAIEAGLDAAALQAWTAALAQRKVSVFLPRFKVSSSFALADELAALGMKDAFDPDRADLSGLDGTRTLYIKDVVHESFVEVNEEGTEAAASTGVVVGVRSAGPPPPEFRADRPFLFFIRHEDTGSILFLGRLVRPGA